MVLERLASQERESRLFPLWNCQIVRHFYVFAVETLDEFRAYVEFDVLEHERSHGIEDGNVGNNGRKLDEHVHVRDEVPVFGKNSVVLGAKRHALSIKNNLINALGKLGLTGVAFNKVRDLGITAQGNILLTEKG